MRSKELIINKTSSIQYKNGLKSNKNGLTGIIKEYFEELKTLAEVYKDKDAMINLAYSYYYMNNFPKAREWAYKAFEYGNYDGEAVYALIGLYVDQTQKEKYIKMLKHAASNFSSLACDLLYRLIKDGKINEDDDWKLYFLKTGAQLGNINCVIECIKLNINFRENKMLTEYNPHEFMQKINTYDHSPRMRYSFSYYSLINLINKNYLNEYPLLDLFNVLAEITYRTYYGYYGILSNETFVAHVMELGLNLPINKGIEEKYLQVFGEIYGTGFGIKKDIKKAENFLHSSIYQNINENSLVTMIRIYIANKMYSDAQFYINYYKDYFYGQYINDTYLAKIVKTYENIIKKL